MTEKVDLVQQIGGVLMRRAEAAGDDWDYAGWVFETIDGKNYGGEIFRYKGMERRLISLGNEQRAAAKAFMRLRELTQGDDGKPWIKCLLAIRKHDKALKVFFEFDDRQRWKLTPSNTEQSREILLAESFPEIRDGS